MKVLSIEPPLLEKTVWQIGAIVGILIVNVAPFFADAKLSTDFYIFYFLIMLIPSGFIIGVTFMYKNVYYDHQYLKISSKGIETIIPLCSIDNVFYLFTLCYIKYSENQKSKSISFHLNTPSFFSVGIFSNEFWDFKRTVSAAKRVNG